MVKVGIIGLGFMGKMHFGVYSRNRKAKVVAVADANARKLKGDWRDIAGNIGDTRAGKANLSGITRYVKAQDLINDPDVQLVDITLPTFLHAKYIIAALKAGKDVMCEKPMSLNLEEADEILNTVRKCRSKLMIAHCIRFWPEYVMLRDIVKSRKYGKLYSLTMSRLSSTPVWGWKNWQQTAKLSGGAAIDLHIHDTDFINWCFGLPRQVFSAGVSKTSGAIDHIVTHYGYGKTVQITAEGGWAFPKTFGFEMSFRAILDKASIEYSSLKKPTIVIHTSAGSRIEPRLPHGDGYEREIDYFLDCVIKDKKPAVVTPEDARDAVRVVTAEIQSALKGKPVKI